MNSSASSPSAAPLVSVVIPAYNAGKYLARTVESVIAQTLDCWQCLIVDDGSTDDTAAIARELCARDGRVQLVQQTNGGVSTARNLGLERSDSSAPFVLFLDADDTLEPATLEVLVATLRQHEEAVACHCNAFYIDGDGHRFDEGVLEEVMRNRYFFDGRRIARTQAQDPTTFAAAVTNCPIITPGCVLMRRSALERVGAFNPALKIIEDWDLWVRLTRLSPLLFVDRPLLGYRRHQTNSSSNRREAMAQTRRLRTLIIDSPDNTPAQSQTAGRAYRAFYGYQARKRYRATATNAFKPAPKAAAQNLALALANTAMAVKGRP